eukprot:3422946-Pyramimonas_sp.AAC.1
MEHPMPASWRLVAASFFSARAVEGREGQPAASAPDSDQCEHGQFAWALARPLGLCTGALRGRPMETPGHMLGVHADGSLTRSSWAPTVH